MGRLRGVVAGLAWMAVAGLEVRAQEIRCPAEVEVRQSAGAVPAGWMAGQSQMPTRLESVTFYIGPPEERASLVPDTSKRRGGALTSTWRFARGSKELFWVSCSYVGTTVVLSRALPAGVSGCTVEYDTGAMIGGLPLVWEIRCR